MLDERTLDVDIPAGIHDGQRIRITGQGHAGVAGTRAGDVYVQVHVRPDPRFVRDGNDVFSNVDLTMTQASLGTTVTIRAGGRVQWRDVASGDSYLSTHDPRPHFGLGPVEIVDEVDVKWPDGTHTVKRQVKARQMLHVRKGS